MEFPSSLGGSAAEIACLSYDLDEARLLLVQGAEKREIQVRAQAHRLIRHMVERNAASGGAPALCTHDELMHAVWADEPMHTREELAKLVWELRKKLEPFGAAHLIENERGRGYRMRTCPPAIGGHATTGDSNRPVFSRPRILAAALIVAALGAAAVAAVVLGTRGSENGSSTAKAAAAKERTFVDRVENVLQQAASGRKEIRSALTAGLNCSISSHEAGRRIASVADNRQSILGQLGNLQTPTQEAADAVTFLQQALQQSIEADRHYRDGFFTIAQASAGCPVPPNASFRLAAQSNTRATSAKRHFVSIFNPLAGLFHRRTWSAAGF
jgi:DNA-binding winged helix-turn-helix (wHTH) protein